MGWHTLGGEIDINLLIQTLAVEEESLLVEVECRCLAGARRVLAAYFVFRWQIGQNAAIDRTNGKFHVSPNDAQFKLDWVAAFRGLDRRSGTEGCKEKGWEVHFGDLIDVVLLLTGFICTVRRSPGSGQELDGLWIYILRLLGVISHSLQDDLANLKQVIMHGLMR